LGGLVAREETLERRCARQHGPAWSNEVG
jgi:hypothetical protein